MNVSSSLRGPGAVSGRRLDVVRTLSPVARAIGLRRVARGASLGFGVGAAVGAVILALAHLQSLALAVPLALGLAALGLLAGAAFGLARWPRPMDAARAADLQFELDDRLTTALELTGIQTPVADLQSRDLERRIDGVNLRSYRDAWLHRREAGILALVALVFAVALVLVPSGSHHVAAQTPVSSTKARHAAARQVQRLTSQLHLGLTPAQLQSPAMRKLDAALTRLRHQLLQSTTPRTGLRAISATQQQLRQIAQGLHPVNSRAVAQLNSSLAHYLKGTNAGKGRQSSSSRSNAATARALQNLARSLSRLSPAQRAALAQALSRAANATQDNALRQALRQAAASLANGQTQAAQAALRQAAQQLAQSAAAQAARSRLGTAQSQLNSLKSQVSAQMSGSGQPQLSGPASRGQGRTNSGATVPGTGKGQTQRLGTGAGRGQGSRLGQGKGQGQGLGQGTGRAQSAFQRGQGSGQARGTGKGRGIGTGRGTGQGQGQRTGAAGRTGVAGGHGVGGRGTSSRTRSGKTVTVYVPGKQGTGPTIDRTGPNGAPAPGAIVPYQQVIGQYSQSAHQALDRTSLPPSLQGYVRRYFSTLSR